MTTLHTQRLVLRPYSPHDWDGFRVLVQDEELMRPLSGALSLEAAHRLFHRLIAHDAASGLLGWAAMRSEDATYCGHVFLHGFDTPERVAELGFVLRREMQRQGLATELARAMLDYACDALSCRAVRASVDEDNLRSQAVLERIGMTQAARELDREGSYLVYRFTGSTPS